MKHFLTSEQLPGLFIDALVVNKYGQLVFLSAWGSEAYIQQNRAALTLSDTAKAFSMLHFKLVTSADSSDSSVFYPRMVFLEHKKRFDDLVGRPAGHTLFAHLTHWQVYDKVAVSLDRANQHCLLFRERNTQQAEWDARIWQAIQNLSSTPLHSSWEKLIPIFREKEWVRDLPGFGLDTCMISLPTKEVESYVQEAVQSGVLALPVFH